MYVTTSKDRCSTKSFVKKKNNEVNFDIKKIETVLNTRIYPRNFIKLR